MRTATGHGLTNGWGHSPSQCQPFFQFIHGTGMPP